MARLKKVSGPWSRVSGEQLAPFLPETRDPRPETLSTCHRWSRY